MTNTPTILQTARLRLEPCANEHLQGLHAMNSLPEVMRYITGKPETLAETQAMIDRVQARWADWGYSWWSFIHLDTGRIAGAGAIQHVDRDKANPLEIGWRLHPDFWRQGLAIEAAQRMAQFAFDTVRPPELLGVRHPENIASGKVMDKLGMTYRGIERWYGADLAVHCTTAVQWKAHQARAGTASAPKGA